MLECESFDGVALLRNQEGIIRMWDDPLAALVAAAEGPLTPLDVGVVNDRPFVNVASGGFAAEITSRTPPELKDALGGLAYSITGLFTAPQLVPHRLFDAGHAAHRNDQVGAGPVFDPETPTLENHPAVRVRITDMCGGHQAVQQPGDGEHPRVGHLRPVQIRGRSTVGHPAVGGGQTGADPDIHRAVP